MDPRAPFNYHNFQQPKFQNIDFPRGAKLAVSGTDGVVKLVYEERILRGKVEKLATAAKLGKRKEIKYLSFDIDLPLVTINCVFLK